MKLGLEFLGLFDGQRGTFLYQKEVKLQQNSLQARKAQIAQHSISQFYFEFQPTII